MINFLLLRLSGSPYVMGFGNRYRMLVYLKYCFSGLAFPPGMDLSRAIPRIHCVNELNDDGDMDPY